jgi:two-component system, NarL family, nitrate/nitrite response regulator NarL
VSGQFAVIEDHTLFAQAFHMLVLSIGTFDAGSVFGKADDFLNDGKKHDFNLVFVDLNMPEMSGIELILRMKNEDIRSKIIVVSMVNDPMVILKSLDAGANGYIPKNTTLEELKSAIQAVLSNEVFVPLNIQKDIESVRKVHDKNWENRNSDNKINILTNRELEILRLIAQGYSNVDIGEKLYLSHLTVKTHRANILRKLGLKNSLALVKYASELNLN